jgi:hypothetical protein
MLTRWLPTDKRFYSGACAQKAASEAGSNAEKVDFNRTATAQLRSPTDDASCEKNRSYSLDVNEAGRNTPAQVAHPIIPSVSVPRSTYRRGRARIDASPKAATRSWVG